jgi:hypothetical protein
MARGRTSSWRLVLAPEERQPLDRWPRSTTIAARAGPTWEDDPLAGRWPFTRPRGAGGRRPADRRSPVGEALSGPAPRWPGGRPWPRCQGRVFPPPSRSTWCGSPASVQRRWAAASPQGMAPNWRASSWRRSGWRTGPWPPSGGGWPALSASRGAPIAGGLPSPHGTPPLMRPSRPSSLSTRVHGVMTRWSCAATHNPLGRRGVGCLRRRLPSRGTCLPGLRLPTSAVAP